MVWGYRVLCTGVNGSCSCDGQYFIQEPRPWRVTAKQATKYKCDCRELPDPPDRCQPRGTGRVKGIRNDNFLPAASIVPRVWGGQDRSSEQREGSGKVNVELDLWPFWITCANQMLSTFPTEVGHRSLHPHSRKHIILPTWHIQVKKNKNKNFWTGVPKVFLSYKPSVVFPPSQDNPVQGPLNLLDQ